MTSAEDNKCYAATPRGTLIEQIMDATQPKTEREWAAKREIEALQTRVIELETVHRGWIAENAPGGWIDNLRKERDALAVRVAELASTVEHAEIREAKAAKELARVFTERDALAAELAALRAQKHIAWKHEDFDHAVFQENCPKFPQEGWHKLYSKPTPPVREPDWLLETTKELAKAIHRDNYPDVPQWEVFNDLPGVISQIDNMVCGMERKKPVREPLSDAQINEIRLVHGVTSSGRGIREVAQVISFARAIEAITKEQK